MSRTNLFICVLILLSIGFYYLFIDTLSISEIYKDRSNTNVSIFVNLFDFDTGLTRWDLYRINNKSEYWESRRRQVNSIKDPRLRQIENDKLFAEMLEDPAFRKIAQKTALIGGKATTSVLMALF